MLIVGIAALLAALAIVGYVLLGTRYEAGVADGGSGATVTGPTAARSTRSTRSATAASPGELPALLRRTGSVAARLSRSGGGGKRQRRLDLAGNPRNWTAERLLGYKGVGLLAGAVLGLLFGAKHGAGVAVLAAVVLAVAGLLLPDVLVRNLGEKRQQQLRLGLPDALDVLTVCVEAGLGFDAALGRVARNLDGPVAQECARVLQEMQFGKSRTQALRALTDRTDVPELRSFVAAVVQSGELGISLADVLREQARELRIKRRQRAEERAQKLQVKLLLPLITCLLPAMFVVVLGPAVLELIHFFGTVNG